MSENETSPVITNDSITIPRFGGRRETLALPPGSQSLVQQYMEFEQIEDGLDQAAAAIAAAKKIISNNRKQFSYELMGRAKNHAERIQEQPKTGKGEIKITDDEEPPKSFKKAQKDK